MIEAKTDSFAWSSARVKAVRAYSEGMQGYTYLLLKRWVDLVGAGLLLLLLSPVMMLIAVAIKLDSSGAAVFRQRRVGQWGREFTMFKFRSMYADADQQVHREFAKNYINGYSARIAATDAVVYKPPADARITRVGRWLRRTSLDELPQLINVLRGEMSLVGPRPAVGYEVEEYSRWHMGRLAVQPGLTGLAQINGRSGLTFEKIVRLDLEYIRKRSLWVDLRILGGTVPVVMRAKCAG